jgi:hypothetical protein
MPVGIVNRTRLTYPDLGNGRRTCKQIRTFFLILHVFLGYLWHQVRVLLELHIESFVFVFSDLKEARGIPAKYVAVARLGGFRENVMYVSDLFRIFDELVKSRIRIDAPSRGMHDDHALSSNQHMDIQELEKSSFSHSQSPISGPWKCWFRGPPPPTPSERPQCFLPLRFIKRSPEILYILYGTSMQTLNTNP